MKRLFFILCFLSQEAVAVLDAKKAHLSNEWYPSDPVKLHKKLDELDREAVVLYGADVQGVRALVVPHAGLHYSGSLAAGCFRLLDPKKVRRIILLGPSHHMPFKGIILPSYSAYRLRSGVIPVDTKVVKELKKVGVHFTMINSEKKDPHQKEHALEIELPLIQRYAPRAKIVPLVVGALDHEQITFVAHSLKKYIDKNTVVVVSSDFTHYGPRFNNVSIKNNDTMPFHIRSLDNSILQPIFNRSLSLFLQKINEPDITICGKNPLSLLLALFDEGMCQQEVPYLIGYDTSRTKGLDRDHSVSYVGLAFGKKHEGSAPLLTAYEKRSLLELADQSIHNSLSKTMMADNLVAPIISPALQKPVDLFFAYKKKQDPSFITIRKADTGKRPLYKAVIEDARKVALLTDPKDIALKIGVGGTKDYLA